MATNAPAIVCAGEALWDVLPRGEFMGGAPFNVACHLARLGARARLLARLGRDERGEHALILASASGVDVSLVQLDPVLATGEARAVLDAGGSARYEFLTPAAWDAIEATPDALAAVAAADAFVHGTLGCRDPRSRAAIARLAAAARWRAFDPNLRPPFYSRELVEEGLQGAQFVKLNEDECALLAGWYGVAPAPAALQPELARRFGIGALCVTLGPEGAELHWQGRWHAQPGIPTEVADTVGAGDSFLAMLLRELLAGTAPGVALLRAARLASFVASRAGAVPDYDAARFRS
jgi:fructokinase